MRNYQIHSNGNDQTLYYGVGLVALLGGYLGAFCDRRTDSAKSQPDQFRLSQPLGASLQSLHYVGQCVFVVHGLTLPFPVPPQSIPIGIFIVAFALNVFLANTQKRV